jgi:hypothetical protein
MKEGQSRIERYQAMSPRERNIEMKTIFDLAPGSGSIFKISESNGENVNFLQKGMASLDRRRRSIMRSELIERVVDLLSLTKTTESARLCVTDFFNYIFEFGVDKQRIKVDGKELSSEYDHYMEIFGWNNPRSEGLFAENPQEAERIIYKNESKEHMFFRHVDEVISEGLIPEMKLVQNMISLAKKSFSAEELQILETIREEDRIRYQNRIKLFPKWRSEFIQQYGEEP